jgi:hypothetical protein
MYDHHPEQTTERDHILYSNTATHTIYRSRFSQKDMAEQAQPQV